MAAFSSAADARQDLIVDGQIETALEDRLRSVVQQSPEASRQSQTASTGTQPTTRTLLRLMRSEGYYSATVTTTLSESRTVFSVSPGQRFTVREAVILTAPDPSVGRIEPLMATNLKPGDVLSAEAVINAETQSLATLQENGWPNAALLERDVVIDHATATGDVTYNIETGPFSLAGSVHVGSDLLDHAFVERLNPIAPGEIVPQSALRTYQARLTELASVARASVQLEEPEPGTNQRDIEITFTPTSRNVLEAGFSVSTSDGGGIDGAWTRRNLMGRDESLSLTAQMQTREQSLSVSLSAPHWRRHQQTVTLLAAIRNEETDAFDQVEAELEVDVTRQINASWNASIRLGGDASSVRASGQRSDTVSVFSGIAAVLDKRDSSTDPSSGYRAAFAVSPTVVFGDVQSGYFMSEASLRSYRRIGRNWVAAGRIRAGSLIGAGLNAVPADNRYYAGGGGSVRGYEFQSLSPKDGDDRPIGGRSVIEFSGEMRWRGNGRWGAALFADAGISSTNASPDLADLRVGVGAGARYHFDFAPLRFDVAVPLDRRSNEASVHVYIGLGQAF